MCKDEMKNIKKPARSSISAGKSKAVAASLPACCLKPLITADYSELSLQKMNTK